MATLNYLPIVSKEDHVTGCCPRFHPEEWDGKVFDFSRYLFIRTHTKSFFYIPLNMNRVMTKVQKSIDASNQRDEERNLMLSEDVSLFKCNHDILVKGPVPGYGDHHIEGNWYAKVFDGVYKNLPNWMQQLQLDGKNRGYEFKRVLAFYTTCPGCAKTYGHNYVVLFGLI